MESIWHHNKPAKRGLPIKTHGPGKEGIREATKRPKITQKELQSSTEEIGVSVHRTTLSRTLHRAGLYRRVARKKPLLKEKISKHFWCLPKGMWETPQTYGSQMRLKCSFLAINEHAMSGTNPPPLIILRTPSPQ